jgi:hypothetical protein
MNKNKLAVSLFSLVMVGALISPVSASAFWPFDGLFNKGEVKAAVTEKVAVQGWAENSNSAKLSKSLSQMKTICTDLFSTTGATTGQTKEMPRQTAAGIAEGEYAPNQRNKMPAPTNSQENKKVVSETNSLMSLMKNVCKQITTYNDRFGRVYKMPEVTPTRPTVTPAEKKSLIQIIQGGRQTGTVAPSAR